MPGKSKKGGGLESSPIYKKQSPFTLKSGNNLGGRNGEGVKFKQMGGSSPVKQTNLIGSFTNFLKSKQTGEGRDIGELKRRMRSPNIETRTKAQAENRARLKKIREKKADKPRTDVLSKNIRDKSDLTVEDRAKPESRYLYYSGAKGDKYKYRKIQVKYKGGEFYHTLGKKNPENPDDLNPKAFEFQYPEDHEKYKGPDHWETSETKDGAQAIKDAYWDNLQNRPLSTTPINKKSPTKKSGFKMKKK